MFYRDTQDSVPDKDGDKLFRPEIVRTGKTVGTRDLSKLMSTATTLTETDICAVLLCLPQFMNLHLKEGHTVRLDGLGTFTLYSRSQGKGVKKKEDISPSQFTNIVCRFTPEYKVSVTGGRTRALMDGIEFIHIDRIASKANNIGGNNSNNNNDNDEDPTA